MNGWEIFSIIANFFGILSFPLIIFAFQRIQKLYRITQTNKRTEMLAKSEIRYGALIVWSKNKDSREDCRAYFSNFSENKPQANSIQDIEIPDDIIANNIPKIETAIESARAKFSRNGVNTVHLVIAGPIFIGVMVGECFKNNIPLLYHQRDPKTGCYYEIGRL
jgi:hypothetical protein